MSKPSNGRTRFVFLRSGTLFVGLILAVLAFAAYLTLGNVLNPPPYQVVIVVQEVAPGETLRQSMLSVDAQRVHPRVAAEYVLQDELAGWLGATVNEPLHPGDPLSKARLVRAGNPAAVRHLAIALEAPDRVAMVIPVSPETCPGRLLPGDRVDVSLGIGQVAQTAAGGPTAQPTPTAPPPFTLPGGQPAGREEAPPEPREIPAGATVLEAGEISQQLEASLPLAKIVLQSVEVLDAHYEERPNPAYSGNEQGAGPASGGSGAQPYLQGDILSLEVVVPAGAVELLHFAVENGSVRVALLSPNAPAPAERGPTLGMTWDDLAAFFKAQRQAVLGLEAETPDASQLSSAVPSETVAISGTVPVSPTYAAAPTPEPTRPPQPTPQPAAGSPAPSPPPPAGDQAGLATAGPALAGALPFACGGLALVLIPLAVLVFIQRRRRALAAVPANPTVPPPRQPSLDLQP